jgi:F0F1-type ATP synthase assembly protein I
LRAICRAAEAQQRKDTQRSEQQDQAGAQALEMLKAMFVVAALVVMLIGYDMAQTVNKCRSTMTVAAQQLAEAQSRVKAIHAKYYLIPREP